MEMAPGRAPSRRITCGGWFGKSRALVKMLVQGSRLASAEAFPLGQNKVTLGIPPSPQVPTQLRPQNENRRLRLRPTSGQHVHAPRPKG